MKHTELRKKFLEFFKAKGHTIVSSDSLVPAGDPTLLFTSAGMNQFKNEFLGNIKGFQTAASCQKCFRTGDLENVGKTAYHHTFFEMLGNFSFGDYFKKEAIGLAWEFMRDALKLPGEKLWVSVYEEDDEAYGIWKNEISVPESRIIKLGPKDNFWPSEAKEKGPNGPCGPCSEIFYDYGEESGCGKEDCTPACDCGRFVEVWNLVFTQYERKHGGVLGPLPSKNIDTGMGLERLCAVMQGVKSNFKTDLFKPITESISKEIGSEALQNSNSADFDMAAIADHIRAATFAISDGVVPSNVERGYVIRKVINKSLLHARNLGIEEPFLYKLVYIISKVMEEPYPEIMKRHQDIAQVIKFEEERFADTLKDGERLLNTEIEKVKKEKRKELSGEAVFRLFDTHGLPLFIIKEMAEKKGLGIDEQEFNKLLEAQRETSRAKSKLHGAVFVDSPIKAKSEFIGYDKHKSKAKVLCILDKGLKPIDRVDKNSGRISIVLDKPVFYPESGGQMGDSGTIEGKNLKIKVCNARRSQDAILLESEVLKGELNRGDIVDTSINEEKRLLIAKNHTATHLLQSALRKVLGEHVQQQGSFVGSDYLRFDFTHFKQLTRDELDRVEELVNQYIDENHSMKVEEMSLEQARQTGALAFFGDKYEQKVRVVAAGDFSKELCGGTHLDNTSQIGLFKIKAEGSVASGIRRIEAHTAAAAEEWVKENKKRGKEREAILKNKEEEKQQARERLKKAGDDIDTLIERAEEVSAIKLIIEKLEAVDGNVMKRKADLIKERLKKDFIIFLVSVDSEKANLLLVISDNLVKNGVDAAKLIGTISKAAGGSGGGRPNMALGGAKDMGQIDNLLSEAKNILSKEIE